MPSLRASYATNTFISWCFTARTICSTEYYTGSSSHLALTIERGRMLLSCESNNCEILRRLRYFENLLYHYGLGSLDDKI